MSRLFIVETTNNEKWETNHGFHLVEADSKELAIQTAHLSITADSVVTAYDLKEFMRSNFQSMQSGKIKTIIESQTM